MANQFKLLLFLAIVSTINFVVIDSKRNDLRDLASDLTEDEEEMLSDEPDGGRGCLSNWKVDYLMLTVQWSPGVCKSGNLKCVRKPEPEFKIHGLWPQSSSDRNLGFCCSSDTRFDKYRLSDSTYRRIKENWPSISEIPEEVFWNHEWAKHGTCAQRIYHLESMDQYFEQAVDVFKSLRLNENLESNNIKPSMHIPYHYTDIMDALSKYHHAQISFNCASYGNDLALTEVHFCFSTDFLPVHCPQMSWRCRDDLYLLF